MLSIRKKSGRGWNGAERTAGAITHAVPDARFPCWTKALCGTQPGARGNGWQEVEKEGAEVTCPKCLKKMAS